MRPAVEMVAHRAAVVAPRSGADTAGGFYATMSVLVAGVIFVGFGHDADARLIHRTPPCPAIVYVHACVFSAFVALFVAQCAFVRTGNLAAHRSLGGLCVALGATMPILGIATSVAAVRYDAQPRALLALQIQDMVAFSTAFGLAVLWRRRPQHHRRLMLFALCCLSSGAFDRLPSGIRPSTFLASYAGVDLLILVAVVYDMIVLRRVHPVHAVGLPAAVLAQTVALGFLHLA
jgi:hypothetical protein